MGTLSIKPRTPTKLQGIHGHGTGLRQSLVWAWWKTQALFALIDSKTPEDHDLDTIRLLPLPPVLHQYPTLSPSGSLFPEKPEEPLPSLQKLCGSRKQPHLRGTRSQLICFLYVAVNSLLPHHHLSPQKKKAHLGRSGSRKRLPRLGERSVLR